MLFREFSLKPGLLRSLDSIGYAEATPIQQKVLKLALAGKNIVGQSQTGTGKTAAFLLPMLNQIDSNRKEVQALIMAPTRELVTQIGDEIRNLTKYYSVTHACLYGGSSRMVQRKKLQRNPAIIVATPGRLMDFMQQGDVDLKTVDFFILDEVDRMLDMGFVRDIKKVRAKMKNIKQTYTFSATMNAGMKKVIEEHVTDYESIKIGDVVTVDKIHQRYMAVEHEQKIHNLIKLIRDHKGEKVIVFTHTKRNTKTISGILSSEGINAGMLNGNMSQGKRQGTLNDFKKNKITVLVTTDVAARGLNMENIALVVNFDVPIDAKSYVHRIGRTGRAGASGKAIMLVSPMEGPLVREIEKVHKISIKQGDYEVVYDPQKTYGRIKLNRSTDKQGGGRNRKGKNHKRKPKSKSGSFGSKSYDKNQKGSRYKSSRKSSKGSGSSHKYNKPGQTAGKRSNFGGKGKAR